jgi:hypothetical protein
MDGVNSHIKPWDGDISGGGSQSGDGGVGDVIEKDFGFIGDERPGF